VGRLKVADLRPRSSHSLNILGSRRRRRGNAPPTARRTRRAQKHPCPWPQVSCGRQALAGR
jgi:hypothetical protein